jgi:hypothetical protein
MFERLKSVLRLGPSRGSTRLLLLIEEARQEIAAVAGEEALQVVEVALWRRSGGDRGIFLRMLRAERTIIVLSGYNPGRYQ